MYPLLNFFPTVSKKYVLELKLWGGRYGDLPLYTTLQGCRNCEIATHTMLSVLQHQLLVVAVATGATNVLTPIYKPYRYVPPQRVSFSSISSPKSGIDFAILVRNRVYIPSVCCLVWDTIFRVTCVAVILVSSAKILGCGGEIKAVWQVIYVC